MEYLTCDICGKEDETVEEIIDPYVLEIDGIEELITLCDDCYENRRDDI
ncbi:hypothetical protein [Oceanispirochaeta sp.]|jgi:uncharacterized Zn finger protein|nr:hypothetical protein [Oceanispirochaeta sp.]MDA3958387.1 hypothetical protein [Oceanispirochaeta sp.]